jgi:L-aspartate oxidase
MEKRCDFLVIGSGLAGLSFALKASKIGTVVVLAKTGISETATARAQGGIAAVWSEEDTFEKHIADTIKAGGGLCNEPVVRHVVENGPARIQDLIDWGVVFDQRDENKEELDLTKEGGHSKRRVLHVKDATGKSIQDALLQQALNNPNIEIIDHQFAIDLLTNRKVQSNNVGPTECYGAYALDAKNKKVTAFIAGSTVLATGGAGRIYLYTSNWDNATGDGIAMAHRAGARVANLELMQFHPTCLYHPTERNFLITEALRGEGAEIINHKGEAFLKKHDPRGSLAPRDIVARSIDVEMKRTGAEYVHLDISHKPKDFILNHFPQIHEKCLSVGIDMTEEPIPVVPAAHYLCGGILTDLKGQTDILRLFAIGENAATGLHGANRLASNSLLECLVFSHNAFEFIKDNVNLQKPPQVSIPDWVYSRGHDNDEMAVISHLWDEVRRLMWNYVGIVRSNKRLERASNRLDNLVSEIAEYYWNFELHPDILELRNIVRLASLTVKSALKRRECRGVHYNLDYVKSGQLKPKDTIL